MWFSASIIVQIRKKIELDDDKGKKVRKDFFPLENLFRAWNFDINLNTYKQILEPMYIVKYLTHVIIKAILMPRRQGGFKLRFTQVSIKNSYKMTMMLHEHYTFVYDNIKIGCLLCCCCALANITHLSL